jgi:hypothetical protein
MQDRAPGVYIEAAEPSARPIAPARSDVAAFVGISERGPVATPTRVTSFSEYQHRFGSFVAPGFLAYAVRAFFENGGRAAWVVRAVAPALGTTVTAVTGTRLTLAPPLPLRSGTVVALSQPQPPGVDVATALRQVVAADPVGGWIDVAAPIAGIDAREQPAIDTTKSMTLSTGGTVARAALVSGNGKIGALFTASSPGSWGNRVALRVMRERVAETLAVDVVDSGRQIQVESFARFSRGTLVRVRQGTNVEYRVVCDVDPADRTLFVASSDAGRAIEPAAVLNTALPSTFVVGPGRPPISVEAMTFHLLVLENGRVVEDYPDWTPLFPQRLSAQLTAASSRVVIVLDDVSLPAISLDPDTWPADVDAQPLAGATDGVRMLLPADLLAGLAALAPVAEPTLVAIPDACAPGDAPEPPPVIPTPPSDETCTDPKWLCGGAPAPAGSPVAPAPLPQSLEPGPGFDAAESALVAEGLVEFCELGASPEAAPDAGLPPHPSFRFALVDVPSGSDPIDFRRRFDASRAGIHWPWAGVYDPLGAPGAIRFVPPSGHVAGAFAAMDVAIGPHHSAANIELRWLAALARDVDSIEQAVFNDEQVNCLRILPNRGIRIYGARTLSSDGDWLYVPVRRLVSMVESSILYAMQWSVFEPANATLRQLVRQSCLTLLETLWQRGAFAGASRDQAYRVVCDGSNNSPSAQANGELHVDIWLAPVRPAEFIVFRVGHQHDVLEVFEGVAA